MPDRNPTLTIYYLQDDDDDPDTELYLTMYYLQDDDDDPDTELYLTIYYLQDDDDSVRPPSFPIGSLEEILFPIRSFFSSDIFLRLLKDQSCI